jgi:hypothetical protein
MPHHLSAYRKEVLPFLPVDLAPSREFQIGLMNQGGRLKRATGLFSSDVAASDRSQLIIDHWHQPVERTTIAVTPRAQELGNFRVGFHVLNKES